MTYWQVQADLGEGRKFRFGVSASDQETATAQALLVIRDVLVPVDLEITAIPRPVGRL